MNGVDMKASTDAADTVAKYLNDVAIEVLAVLPQSETMAGRIMTAAEIDALRSRAHGALDAVKAWHEPSQSQRGTVQTGDIPDAVAMFRSVKADAQAREAAAVQREKDRLARIEAWALPLTDQLRALVAAGAPLTLTRNWRMSWEGYAIFELTRGTGKAEYDVLQLTVGAYDPARCFFTRLGGRSSSGSGYYMTHALDGTPIEPATDQRSIADLIQYIAKWLAHA